MTEPTARDVYGRLGLLIPWDTTMAEDLPRLLGALLDRIEALEAKQK